jgi:YD repeat-containing protein
LNGPPTGNRTSKTNDQSGLTSNYAYDPLYELTQVTQDASTTESYSYDAVGNRLSSSGVPTYSYNSSNELTQNSLGSYTYDANGNTLSDALRQILHLGLREPARLGDGAGHRDGEFQVRSLRQKNLQTIAELHRDLCLRWQELDRDHDFQRQRNC